MFKGLSWKLSKVPNPARFIPRQVVFLSVAPADAAWGAMERHGGGGTWGRGAWREGRSAATTAARPKRKFMSARGWLFCKESYFVLSADLP